MSSVPHTEDFSSTPGRGVRALVDGVRVQVGAPALLADLAASAEQVAEARLSVRRLEEAGRTAVVVVADGAPAGSSPSRTGCVPVLGRRLHGWHPDGSQPILLTGDNERAARRLAEEVGIVDVRAGLLPDEKVAEVRALQEQGLRVLLVGDGVNDAPAMAAAELGVAMGRHGSDLALETADAVIVRDDLSTLPKVVGLSRRAHRVVKANLAFAATVITVLVIWDVIWILPLPLGVAGHEGSTIVVGLNGLRLLRRPPGRRRTGTSAEINRQSRRARSPAAARRCPRGARGGAGRRARRLDESRCQHQVTDRATALQRGLGDLGRGGVPEVRREGGDDPDAARRGRRPGARG